jgi:hypothetical protein
MAWKISFNVERNPEALYIAQRMVFTAAKAQGASDFEAYTAAHSLRDAFSPMDARPSETGPASPGPGPVQIDLEYDEETLTLSIRDRQQRQRAPEFGRH